MSETPEPESVEVEPATALQNTLSEIGGDALCVGYACVVEWVEPDGSRSVEVIHTDMAPWHLKGLMEWGIDLSTSFILTSDALLDDDDDF